MARPLLWLAILCSSVAFATCGDLHLKLTHRLLASKPARLAENQYSVEYLVGDPPQKAEAIVDTASNLVWTQSAACSVCFRQDLPRYDPSLSRAARNLTCSDAACAAGIGSATQCSRSGTECYVHTAYNAFEEIAGDLSTDEFTFGSEKVSLAFGTIGASTLTRGSLGGASGIVGLGRGPLSLVSQLSETKFSYCLTPFFGDATNPSHLLVGASAAALSGGGAPVTSVPFVKNPKEYPFSTYYYLPLAGITVGKTKLDVAASAFDLREVKPGKWAGTVVDTGAPFMSLVDEAYRALKTELEQQLGGSLVRPPKVVLSKRLELCVAQGDLARLVPPLVLRFGSGGEVVLPPENYWSPVGNETACMVVFSSARKASAPMNETTVIGSYMQQNMQLLYDLGKHVLSFQPANCSSFVTPAAETGRDGTTTARKGSSPSPPLAHLFLFLSLFCL